jgi:hypothetical protein
MSLLLAGGVAALLAWGILAFATTMTSGAIHLLLAIGSTLLVGWWALRE